MALKKMSIGNALWLSITTVITVGYGDYSASTWQDRVVTAVFLHFYDRIADAACHRVF